ncbi:MAG: pyruvate formate lyase family protein [Desulfomonilia bacterium]
MACTVRNRVLRDETCIKSLGRIADKRAVREGLKICLERARIMTEVFQATEGEPMNIRRAKGLAAVLDRMTLFTRPGELVVGCYASTDKGLPTYPELYWRWLEKAVKNLPDYSAMITEEEKHELFRIHEYWKPFSIHGRERDYIPEGRSWRIGDFITGGWMWQWEISTPNYEKIMRLGLDGIVKEIDSRLTEVQGDLSIPTEKRMKMMDQLRAMKIATEAAARWGKRYAEMLVEHKKTVDDPTRIAELDRMIQVCKQVPAGPARNLHEALQCFIFITFIINYIDQPQVGNGIRFDKIFAPFLEKDLAEGVLTRDQAKELVEAVWVKMQEGGYVQPPQWVNNGGGGLGFQTITLGGTDEKGKDITGEMTYIALEVTGELQTIAPQIAVRIHDKTPKKLYQAVCKCVRTGCSQPALFNDRVNLPRLEGLGCSKDEARLYSINNCMQPVIPGRNCHYRAGHSGGLVLPMCLNLALDEGRFNGKVVGSPTPPLVELKTYEDVWKAFCDQVEFAAETLGIISNIADILMKEYIPRPFLSAVLDGNIEQGTDMREWEYLGLRHHLVFGCNNAADGLAAIKKLVFQDGKISLAEYVRALQNDYKGEYEQLYTMIEREAPKFGNDDDYVDSISRHIMLKVRQECDKWVDIYGKPFILDGTTASAPIGAGMILPATCDARRSSEPFHDGSISPVQGKDTAGPTATVRSVAKVNPLETGNFLLNQKFMPSFFEPDHYDIMEGYMKTLKDMGVHHVQFNCVDRDTLVTAQAHPENYQNLIVRVAGYSAYFVDLDNRMQDEIIKRTEQAF